ncbi:DUF3892 domain-containing protein [Falsibacillus albus]|uniref:DUF3892 domain-containing protein n=1 Tax=Falsibacillus albus TaxID=2478915 RepID=A0A3L7JWD5_9BACI|nr:DUF3892 domain-containing protein [Falsibacillus albus]RLQ95167.1 DUF3892 domain-containing protein [Falsibacillus albus]
METIEKVQRNHLGNIISFETSSGRIISYQKAIQEIENGLITDVSIQVNADGSERIDSVAGDDPDFNEFPPIF